MVSILGILSGVEEIPAVGGNGTSEIRGLNPDGIVSTLRMWRDGVFDQGSPANPDNLNSRAATGASMNLTTELGQDLSGWINGLPHLDPRGGTIDAQNAAEKLNDWFISLEQGIAGSLVGTGSPQDILDVARLELDWPEPA